MASELMEQIRNAPLPTPEHLFAKGTLMPFNCTNSGVRKLMFSTNLEQRLALCNPDVPYVQTGFENQFGKFSSSFRVAEQDYTAVGIIPKFSNRLNDHYFLIMLDESGTMLDVIERTEYNHITETFGYINDNSAIDAIAVGGAIPKGTVLHKSRAFDEYNNRMDGKNLLALFNASEETMEDSIIISESASEKLASPLIHKFNITFNINDIPLNLFGDSEHYKVFPDIGEMTKNDILCAIRKEKKEEAFYAQDFNRLSTAFMSDEKITVFGKVVDIDIQCNNPEIFEDIYYQQLKYYYDEHIRMCKEIVTTVDAYRGDGSHVKMSYNLQKLYYDCLKEINGGKFLNERVFSGIIVTVTVVENIKACAGDKLTNRYGGKGVISRVKPDYLMPKTYDGETIDIQINMCGVYGRENGGQLFEMSYNYRAKAIVKAMCSDFKSMQENLSMVLTYYRIVSPKQYKALVEYLSGVSDDTLYQFMSSIIDDGILYTDVDPGSDTPSLETIRQLNQAFPFIQQEHILMPLEDSNGNVRYVTSRRPVVCGYIYYYRLKQHAEEKFSVTSLSATNIKNENSRNKASKVYKAQFSRTPIRFGDMELGDLSHMGIDLVVQVLMLYSSSPEARMLCESAMTGNPYNVDIQLENNSRNIGAEILATYLKTIGLALKFTKIPKIKNQPFLRKPFKFLASDKSYYHPFTEYQDGEFVDHEAVMKRAEDARKYRYPFLRSPFNFDEDQDTHAEFLKKQTQKYHDEAMLASEQAKKIG